MKNQYCKGIAVLLALLSMLSLCSCGTEAQEPKQEEPKQEVIAKTEKEEKTQEEKPTPKEEKVEIEEKPEQEETKASLTGIRPEFQEAMDSYEQFFDEYCEIMQEYKANPTDLELLSKSAELASKSIEVSEKFEAWDSTEMSLEESKLYLDVSVRVEKKMLEIMQ